MPPAARQLPSAASVEIVEEADIISWKQRVPFALRSQFPESRPSSSVRREGNEGRAPSEKIPHVVSVRKFALDQRHQGLRLKQALKTGGRSRFIEKIGQKSHVFPLVGFYFGERCA
jgi:hypothetical protein